MDDKTINDSNNQDQTPTADCRYCSYRMSLLLSGRCSPGDICVKAESGRQIDRFFRINPQYAEVYLRDDFWERRAIAVRYAPVDALDRMIADNDEAVRRAVAYRLPREQLPQLMNDKDREVRITVADRIAETELEKMADDVDYLVRAYVAQRSASHLADFSALFEIRIYRLEKLSLNVFLLKAWD